MKKLKQYKSVYKEDTMDDIDAALAKSKLRTASMSDFEQYLDNVAYTITKRNTNDAPSYVKKFTWDSESNEKYGSGFYRFHVSVKDFRLMLRDNSNSGMVGPSWAKFTVKLLKLRMRATGIDLNNLIYKVLRPVDKIEGFVAVRGDDSFFEIDGIYISDAANNALKVVKKIFLVKPRYAIPDEFRTGDFYRLWWD